MFKRQNGGDSELPGMMKKRHVFGKSKFFKYFCFREKQPGQEKEKGRKTVYNR
jgi:hypothetical protein